MNNLGIGNTFLGFNQPDLALEYLQNAVEDDPNCCKAWSLLGKCHIFLDSLQDAERALKKAVELSADDAEIWLLLGVVYKNTNRERKAIECFTRTQELGLSTAKMFQILGSIYIAMDKLAEAEENLHRSIEIAPDDAYTYKLLTVIARRRKDADRAEKLIKKAIELDPQNVEFRYYLGAIQQTMRKNCRKAIEIFLECNEIDSSRFEVWNDLGLAYLRLGEYTKCRRCLKKSMELAPLHYRPYYNLACAASLEGIYDEALEYLEKAFQMAPKRVCKNALTDEDLQNLWNDTRFIHLFLKYCGEE